VDVQAAPVEIVALAEQRARARADRDWPAADALKARIEAAGWKVVDRGLSFTLQPARPPDIEDAGRRCHGSPDSVPARHSEPDEPGAGLVMLASVPAAARATLAAARQEAPVGTPILVVAPRSFASADLSAASDVIWTAAPFAAGAALRAALRQVTREIVVVLDEDRAPSADVVSPLVLALTDPDVGVAGALGRRSLDLWHHSPGEGDVTVVLGCYAFRRQDALASDPPDDRLVLPDSVATWLSLCLRDRGPDVPPRRAITVALPLRSAVLHESGAEHVGAARRDAYRIADRFRAHEWLRATEQEVARTPGVGAGGHDHDDEAHEGGHPGHLA
jgi:hypothetical protein